MTKKLIVTAVSAAILGFITAKLMPEKSIGNLRIDESDPTDEPYLFLELDHDVGDIRKKKKVTLRVLNENYVPAK